MANSLTIRLCQQDPDPARNIALSPFCDALMSVLHGAHSIAGIKGFYNMTSSDEAAFDTLVGKITSTLDLTERAVRIHRIGSILKFWEWGNASIVGYTTVDEVEAWLLAIDEGP